MIGSQLDAIRSWQQRHDNGWLARVVEQPDGTFIAWAAPIGTTPICLDYLEDSLQFAQDAALFALRRETAHHCSASCESWSGIDLQCGAGVADKPTEVEMAKRTAKRKTAAKRTTKRVAKRATRKTAKRKGAAKRQRISPRGDARFVRRDAKGRIKESDDVGRAQRTDRPRKAKRKVKSGQGDKGDR